MHRPRQWLSRPLRSPLGSGYSLLDHVLDDAVDLDVVDLDDRPVAPAVGEPLGDQLQLYLGRIGLFGLGAQTEEPSLRLPASRLANAVLSDEVDRRLIESRGSPRLPFEPLAVPLGRHVAGPWPAAYGPRLPAFAPMPA